MRKCYTRPCNFYYGNYARKLIEKKKALSLAGNPNIAFDQLEIFERKKKRIIKSSLHSINGIKALSREEYEMLAKAHYSLALMYTKKDWWNYALREAETCFQLLPTREHYDIVTLLRKRIDLQDTES